MQDDKVVRELSGSGVQEPFGYICRTYSFNAFRIRSSVEC